MTQHYLACDLGAESGRLMLGSLSEGILRLQELHRFANTPVQENGSLVWDVPGLWQELRTGLLKAAASRLPIASISTDSWGVDYVLLDEHGQLMPPAYHYRDARTARGVARVRELMDEAAVFAETGLQFMPLNTLYQLAAEPQERLSRANRFLMVADAFNFFLSGTSRVEESNASTSQLYNPRTRNWSAPLLEALSLPARLFPQIVPSGTALGQLRPELAAETGLAPLPVIASCSHDTGAAVAAIPVTATKPAAGPPDWAYLSSGTWSLMGVELASPLITEACRQMNFTNEIGYGGSVRLLKNISGLWLVQECRREWAAEGQVYDYPTLTRLAGEAAPFVSLIHPADPSFLSPGQMPQKIARYCLKTGQAVPASPGAFVRCALESLALLYRCTLHQIEQLIEQPIRRLHVVGGGTQNTLLNQFTAQALGIPVSIGPVEATAMGNVLVQAIALGHLPSLAAARQVVARSFPPSELTAVATEDWAEAARRLSQLPIFDF